MTPTTRQRRVPKGVPVGGQFTAVEHGEALGLSLSADADSFPELHPYGNIPAPLPGQTMEDGSPAAATFEESYRVHFAPLDEHEAVQGPYTAEPSLSEAEILDLAGIGDVNLGRHRGTYLERDEDTGEPVIVVHTRNGGGNRECWQDDCDGQCTGCIQTDTIPALPTYLRDQDDDGDCTYANNYFRPADADAGAEALKQQEYHQKLSRLAYYRKAIIDGTQPPWIILSPVRNSADRDRLRSELQKLTEQARYRSRDRRHADTVQEALRARGPLPQSGMARVPAEYYSYGTALKYLPQEEEAAAAARQSADILAVELAAPLPPAVKALAIAERTKLVQEADRLQAKAAETERRLKSAAEGLKKWADILHRDADEADAKVAAAEAKLKDFDWSESFPGNTEECPPRPAGPIPSGR